MSEITAIPKLPPRAVDAHKGQFGRVLVVAGSRGMAGAAVLCGTSVMRSGAGLATVACPDAVQDIVAAGFPCYTTMGLPSDATAQLAETATEAVRRPAETFDALAVGPGLGRGAGVNHVVRNLLKLVTKPMVLDADALNVAAPLNANAFTSRKAATVLTPHPEEFSRLTNEAIPQTHEQRVAAALRFTKIHNVVLLLKGHRTIVAKGEDYYVNSTGNPGMASGGSGDVLTGLIAALIGQGLTPFDAAVLGAHLHGRAGDLAAEALGQISMTAVDIIHHLSTAFRECG